MGQVDHGSGEHHRHVVVAAIVVRQGKLHLVRVGSQGDDFVRLWVHLVIVEWKIIGGNLRNWILRWDLFGFLLLLFQFIYNSLLDELFLPLLPQLALRVLGRPLPLILTTLLVERVQQQSHHLLTLLTAGSLLLIFWVGALHERGCRL